jgi:hypothetical protein
MLAPAAKALTLLYATVMLRNGSPGVIGMVLDRCIAPPPKPAVLFRNATLDMDRFEFTPACQQCQAQSTPSLGGMAAQAMTCTRHIRQGVPREGNAR